MPGNRIALSLKRPGRVNHDRGSNLTKLCREIGSMSIHAQRFGAAAGLLGGGSCLLQIAPTNQYARIRLLRERSNDAAAEVAVTAEDDDGLHESALQPMGGRLTSHGAHGACFEYFRHWRPIPHVRLAILRIASTRPMSRRVCARTEFVVVIAATTHW